MERRLRIYLRTYRLRWGLTQPELARLLGFKSATHVSRLERGERNPTASTVMTCIVIFGEKAVEIFPAAVTAIEEELLRRAYDLYLDLQGKPAKAVKLKLDLLEQVLKRVSDESHQKRV